MRDKICVVGLGYVGLPLAIEFGKLSEIICFDVDEKRVSELRNGNDRTGEISRDELKKARIDYTTDPAEISKANFIIIAVPTPVTKAKKPDLTYLESASKIVGENLSEGSIIVFESTVYPGVTEDVCKPIIESSSGLKCGKKFFIGYSPERINPGDKEHTVGKIVKIVSGCDEKTTDKIAEVYSRVIRAGVHKAKNIKTAEAAKVIENIQRDLNIALVNELSLIFEKMNINTRDVLDAASTKWNFHKYYPGLVGGHCIGVDPYYLVYKAQELGHHPEVILAGRGINDHMAKHIALRIEEKLKSAGKSVKDSKILILGLTFKENVPDTRNSKVKDIIAELNDKGAEVFGYDPYIGEKQIREFNAKHCQLNECKDMDCIVIATAHDAFKELGIDDLRKMTSERPVLFDIKSSVDRKEAEEKGFIYWSL